MFNQVILIGRTGGEPEIIKLESGKILGKISLATSEKYVKSGESITDTTWHQIVAWGNLATVLEKFVPKGAKIQIVGQIKNHSYEDKEGIKRCSSEIVASQIKLLDKKEADDDSFQMES